MRIVAFIHDRPRATAIAAMAAVLLLALLLRIADLLSLPIFTDEAIYLHWARDIWALRTRESLLIPIADDGKQPLFMWMAGGVMQLIKDPLLAGRLVSALVGTITVIAVYLTGRQLAGTRTGLIAALAFAVAPFAVLFDRLALPDGPLSAMGAWTLCLGVFIATTADRRRAVLLGIALGVVLGAAAWTKLTFIFLLPFPLICLVCLSPTLRLNKIRVPLMGLAAALLVGGAFVAILAMVPDAAKQLGKVGQHSLSVDEFLAFPVKMWMENVATYVSWIASYFPAPLSWFVLAGAVWGVARRPRVALLLLGCWAGITLPLIVSDRLFFTTRYFLPGMVPLVLLAALLVSEAWDGIGRIWPLRGPGRLSQRAMLRALLILAVMVPSLLFDARLIVDPASAAMAETDRWQLVTSWPSGYGFPEATRLVRERAAQLGGEVIVISDHFHGLPYDGLSLYLEGVPGIHFYVDGHIPWGGKGIVEAWRPHHVPVLIMGADGRDDLEAFELQVPEARRIGLFQKPGGEFSFRVYEMEP